MAVSVSQPSKGFPLQSANPDTQVYRHDPDVHVVTVLGLVAQTVPHDPQWLTSTKTLASQPSAGRLLQSAKGAMHVPTAQWEFMQVAVAFGTVQTVPHPPQLPALVTSSTHALPQHESAGKQAWPLLHPGTHSSPAHTIPAGHCASVRHCTHAWVEGSHTSAVAPPSPTSTEIPASPEAPVHPSSVRHPATQVWDAGSQCCEVAHESGVVTQPTHRPVEVSHAGPVALPTQSADTMQ